MKMDITSRFPRRMRKTLVIRAIILTSVLWLGYSSCNWRTTGKTVFTEDRSFTMEEAMADGFERPPMQPELIGDEDYLYSLPRAKQVVYDQGPFAGDCTNSLEKTRVTLENNSGYKTDFRIPLSYIINGRYRSVWTRSEFKKYSLPSVSFLLPDFRAGCLRDRLKESHPAEPSAPEFGAYIFSGVRLDISYYNRKASKRVYAGRPYDWYLEQFPEERGEVIPGLMAYGPDFNDPGVRKRLSRSIPGILLPIDPDLREKYYFRCQRNYETSELYTYTCTGYGSFALDDESNRIRYQAMIRGYMPEWQQVMEHSEIFIRHWHEGE